VVVVGTLPEGERVELATAFGAAELARAYDAPEALRVAASDGDDLARLRPLPGVRVAIDEGGALEVCAATTMLGYLDDPVATQAAVRHHDGARWVRTGTRARLDRDAVIVDPAE
jgi:capsular polysaccharide biosynthesis protein